MGASLPARAIDQLTEKQAKFVKLVTEGVPRGRAAELAGYSAPDQDAWRLVRTPSVIAALHEERERIIKTEVGSLGLARLIEGLQPGAMARKDQLGYIRTALQMAGHLEKASENKDLSKKDPHQMSAEELRQFIDMGRKSLEVLDSRAKDITPGPADSARDDARIVDVDPVTD